MIFDAQAWWSGLSGLGSLNVTVPLAAAVAVWLAAARRRRLVLAWCMLFGAALAIPAASQVAFIGWGWGIAPLAFTGFSGHAARAAAVFPVALFLLAGTQQGRWRRVVVPAAVLLAIGVAVARVQTGFHVPSEAVSGCVLGLACAARFIANARAAPPIAPQPLAAGLLAATMLLACTEPVNSHQWLTVVALKLSGRAPVSQHSDWQSASPPALPAVR